MKRVLIVTLERSNILFFKKKKKEKLPERQEQIKNISTYMTGISTRLNDFIEK